MTTSASCEGSGQQINIYSVQLAFNELRPLHTSPGGVPSMKEDTAATLAAAIAPDYHPSFFAPKICLDLCRSTVARADRGSFAGRSGAGSRLYYWQAWPEKDTKLCREQASELHLLHL